MVNLFRRVPQEAGGLTAGLLALLEHSDRALLNDFLRLAGAPGPAPTGALDFGLTGGTGEVVGPDFRVQVVTEAPGETAQPESPAPGAVAVTVTGRAPEGALGLSWEQVDRWLAASAARYDPDGRTGFLIGQFRDFLTDSGISYFAGFGPGQPEAAAAAFDTFSGFLATAGSFYERLGPALGAQRGGTSEIRQARPEDVLTGYLYRDYAGPALPTGGFLRVAFHLPTSELQLSLWFAPGLSAQSPHARLRTALLEDEPFLAGLQQLDGEPLLWLWSPNDEQRLPLKEFTPESISELNWAEYQVAVQASIPLTEVAGEGLVQRVGERIEALAKALDPVQSGVVH